MEFGSTKLSDWYLAEKYLESGGNQFLLQEATELRLRTKCTGHVLDSTCCDTVAAPETWRK